MLVCPLDSIDTEVIEWYQMQIDNFIFAVHPGMRQLITGELELPLLSYKPYLEYMRSLTTSGTYLFNHAKADEDMHKEYARYQ